MQTPASGCAHLEMRKEGGTLTAEYSQKNQEKAGWCLKSHPAPHARTRVEPGGAREAPSTQELWQRLRKQATPRLGHQMREPFQARSLTVGKKIHK